MEQLINYLRGFFPEKLPIGMHEFDIFCEDLFATYCIPENDTYRRAVATMIMHLGPTTHKKAKYFFAKSIKKAQANEVAYQIIQDINDKEKQVKLAAVTASNEGQTLDANSDDKKAAAEVVSKA